MRPAGSSAKLVPILLSATLWLSTLALLPLLFCACFDGLRSQEPVSDPRMDRIDEELLGEWVLVEPRLDEIADSQFQSKFVISEAADPDAKGLVRMKLELHSQGKPVSSKSYLASSAQFGKAKFLNIFSLRPFQEDVKEFLDEKNNKRSFSFQDWRDSPKREVNVVRYDVRNDELIVVNYTDQTRQRLETNRAKDAGLTWEDLVVMVAKEVDEKDPQQAVVTRYVRPSRLKDGKPID